MKNFVKIVALVQRNVDGSSLVLSEREVIILLLFLFLVSRSCTTASSSYASSWLRVIEQVQNIIHKIVLVRVLFVV